MIIKDFFPVNDLLLCETVPIPDKVGEIYIPDPDKWQKWGRVIAVSPKLSPFADEYKVGDVFIYPNDAKVYSLGINEKNVFLIKKINVITKIILDEGV